MNLPQKIRALRKEKGMSQVELAEAMNVSRQAISGWEAGTSKPSVENLKYLSDFYDVSLDWLCGEDDITDGKKRTHEYADKRVEKNEKRLENHKWNKLRLLMIIIAAALIVLGVVNNSVTSSLIVGMTTVLITIIDILAHWIRHIVVHTNVNKDGDKEQK